MAWREGTRTRIAELAALNTWVYEQRLRDQPAAVQSFADLYHATIHHLQAALEATQGKRSWWRLDREGARLERALSNLDAAEANLVRGAPASFVLGQASSILHQVQRHLPRDDPRRKQVEAIAKVLNVSEADKPPQLVPPDTRDPRLDLVEQERGTLVAGLRGASSAAVREQTRLQSFRNVIVVTTVAMAVVGIALAIIGWRNPTAIPLCFAPETNELTTVVCPTQESDPFLRRDTPTVGAAATTVATSATAPTGDAGDDGTRDIDDVLKSAVGPGNIAIVELIGVTAAAISAANTIRRVRGSSEPYGVPIALAVLKLPTGAVTAFLGLLLMRGGFVPGLSALDTSAQILAWAVVFGYAQQLFTRLVDERAHAVLESVRGGTEQPAR